MQKGLEGTLKISPFIYFSSYYRTFFSEQKVIIQEKKLTMCFQKKLKCYI